MTDVRKLGRVKTPRLARWMLRIALPQPECEFLLGDLEEQFHNEILRRAGRSAARRWYWKQAWATVAGEAPKHPWEKRKGAGFMETFWQDLRHGTRLMAKTPAFTLVAVLTLALGIGANAAIFSVVNAVLLRPLPYPEPEKLVMVWETAHKYNLPRVSLSPHDVRDYSAAKSFASGASWVQGKYNYADGESPVRLYATFVSSTFFQVVGVQPFLGRAFTAGDARETPEAVIVSYGFWRRSLGADPAAIGRSIRLSGLNRTVVGVMPEGFSFPPLLLVEGAAEPASDLFVPLWLSAQEQIDRSNHNYKMMARLVPGASLQQAMSELQAVQQGIIRENPEVHGGLGLEVLPLHGQMVEKIRPALLVLMGAVGFVLLIACANLANLLLAKSASRERETAVRIALGASRGRLVRAFLTEGMALALAGATAGMLLCVALVRLIPLAGLSQIPRLESTQVDAGVTGFTLALCFLAALMYGIVPALQASRADVQGALKEGGRGGAAGRSLQLFRQALIACEVAVAIVLLTGAGLLLRSFTELQKVDVGFNTRNVLTAEFQLPGAKYSEPEQRRVFFHELIERTRAIPGVTQAAAVRSLPLTGSGWQPVMALEGREVRSVAEGAVVEAALATPEYFRTMGIPLVAGREFAETDQPGKPAVAIVDEIFVNRWLAGKNPIGTRIRQAFSDDPQEPWTEIVGVVKAVRRNSLTDEMKPSVYFPHAQRPFGNMTLVVRTSVPPSSVLSAVRQAVAQIDREQPMGRVVTLEQEFSSVVAQPRLTAWLLGVFAAVALALAAIGAYGVISYSVAQRTHEIGVRMALGAAPSDVRAMVLRQGMGVVLAGTAAGLVASLALARVLRSMLYGVSSNDPATYSVVTALLLLTALLACWIPARRATRVDPLIALRHE